MDGFKIADILSDLSLLAEQIHQSEESKAYLEAKARLEDDAEAQELIRQFQIVKDDFSEAQRFGIFHPNYHEAKEKAILFQTKINQHPTIAAFRKAEQALDHLLYQVSATIAQAVSPTIKVPANEGTAQWQKQSCRS